MIVMALLFIWQMALVAYTVVVAESAARDGARVAAVGGDIETAVERSAYGLEITEINDFTSSTDYGEEVTVTVTAMIPSVKIPMIGRIEQDLTADASMPKEEDD